MTSTPSNRRPARRPKAATADVLGNAPKKDRVPSRWKKHYRRLLELRDVLLRRKGQLVQDAVDEQPVFSLHMADAGTDSYDRDFALSRISSEQGAVYEIDQALDRIRAGTYGVCELTGKAIERKRLEAIPWARFSAEAEKELEREGEVRRTRLAPREAVVRRSPEAVSEEEEE